MEVKLFGDTIGIDWKSLNVRMPFAPMHQLAQKYEKELEPICLDKFPLETLIFDSDDWLRTFELTKLPVSDHMFKRNLMHTVNERIFCRVANTIEALDQCTADTICINLQGGYHHAGKTPGTGYAYSLINDHIWAVDYQLEKYTRPDYHQWLQIIDLDYHFAGGTINYYKDHPQVGIVNKFNKRGFLHQHINSDYKIIDIGTDWLYYQNNCSPSPTKLLLNLGTDQMDGDALFGGIDAANLLVQWQDIIKTYRRSDVPISVTCGGSYGKSGLDIYNKLIDWLRTI